MVLARESSSRISRIEPLTTIGASEAESTPEALPDSIWPALILLLRLTTASSPVAQAWPGAEAGVVGGRAAPSTGPRGRWKAVGCGRPARPATWPMFSRGSPKRAASPSLAEVGISRFVGFAYGLFERAKGMRLPPRMRARWL